MYLVFAFSTANEYWKIKLGVAFILIEYSEYFTRLLLETGGSQALSELVEIAINDHKWANEYIELACSMLIKRPVFTYTYDLKTLRACDQLFCVSMDYFNSIPLTIGFYDNHFVSLVKKCESAITPTPLFNQFMGKYNVQLDDY